MTVRFVGGPADGNEIDDDFPHAVATVNVPVPGVGGFGQFAYTMRKCRNERGEVVKLLAPAGQEIDPTYLAKRGLKN